MHHTRQLIFVAEIFELDARKILFSRDIESPMLCGQKTATLNSFKTFLHRWNFTNIIGTLHLHRDKNYYSVRVSSWLKDVPASAREMTQKQSINHVPLKSEGPKLWYLSLGILMQKIDVRWREIWGNNKAILCRVPSFEMDLPKIWET